MTELISQVKVLRILVLKENKKILVPMRFGETPVPIPNTTVKTQTAEGTTLVTMWENRWVPDSWDYSSAG